MNNSIVTYLRHQLAQEAIATRAMLQLVPAAHFQWQPHPKSMTLLRLATHVAELPGWLEFTIDRNELDFATDNQYPAPFQSNTSLMSFFEERLAAGTAALGRAGDDILDQTWTLRNAGVLYLVSNKGEILRTSLSQLIHHRAQLGVFLRLLNIPIPGTYGPSADEMGL